MVAASRGSLSCGEGMALALRRGGEFHHASRAWRAGAHHRTCSQRLPRHSPSLVAVVSNIGRAPPLSFSTLSTPLLIVSFAGNGIAFDGTYRPLSRSLV